MADNTLTPKHIEIAETFVRLYVFLTQYIDRCEDEAARKEYPEAELQKHLGETRAKMMEILKVNPVVKGKVEKECERVLALGSKCLMGGTEKVAALDVLGAERVILKNKTIALSDVSRVSRALIVRCPPRLERNTNSPVSTPGNEGSIVPWNSCGQPRGTRRRCGMKRRTSSPRKRRAQARPCNN